MNYEDYPILKNEEYKLLNDKYSQTFSFNKNAILHKICLEIQQCLSSCSHINNSFNMKTLETIRKSNQTLEKTLNNLKEMFSIPLQSIKETNNFNIFTYTKRIALAIELITNLVNHEKKEYYKSFILKTCSDLTKLIIALQETLEDSSVHFFRHM